MKATQSIIEEFSNLHERYVNTNQQMIVLQAIALEGMRKIGVGCITEESRTEFINLKQESNIVLERMKAICDSLN